MVNSRWFGIQSIKLLVCVCVCACVCVCVCVYSTLHIFTMIFLGLFHLYCRAHYPWSYSNRSSSILIGFYSYLSQRRSQLGFTNLAELIFLVVVVKYLCSCTVCHSYVSYVTDLFLKIHCQVVQSLREYNVML